MSIDSRITGAKGIYGWLEQHINGLTSFNATDRLRLSVALFDLVHEHSKAVCLLLDRAPAHRLTGSAFALVRPTFETFVRGLWLRHCATDSEIASFANDDKIEKIDKLLREIESKDGYDVGVLSCIKNSVWSAMCSYTHGGQFQAVRRITSESIMPSYADDEIEALIRVVIGYALLAAYEAFDIAGREDLKALVVERVNTLDPFVI